jgi:hypothetical protein
VHSGERPYTCDACNKSFNDKCNLKIHYLICKGRAHIVMFVIVCSGTGVFWRNIKALIVRTGHLPVMSVINHYTYTVICTDITVYILQNSCVTLTFVISCSLVAVIWKHITLYIQVSPIFVWCV